MKQGLCNRDSCVTVYPLCLLLSRKHGKLLSYTVYHVK